MMKLPVAVISIVLCGGAAFAQPPPAEQTMPDFRVHVVGDVGTEFRAHVAQYLELRQALEVGLPPLTLTDDPADILRAERALARRIRRARESRQGQLFTPSIAAEFRRVLRLETDAHTLEAILDENPGAFSHDINGTYPKERPVSTVPANLLAILPELPDDIQYRFLGRHLVLHDTRANVILDRIRCALRCAER
jgi:hypothetical protein